MSSEYGQGTALAGRDDEPYIPPQTTKDSFDPLSPLRFAWNLTVFGVITAGIAVALAWDALHPDRSE